MLLVGVLLDSFESRLVRMSKVKADNLGEIGFQLCSRYPGSFGNVETFPMNEVVELPVAASSSDFGIEYRLYEPSLFTFFVDDRIRRRIYLTRGELVRMELLDERNVEDGMDTHGCGKYEVNSGLADHTLDAEGTQTLSV